MPAWAIFSVGPVAGVICLVWASAALRARVRAGRIAEANVLLARLDLVSFVLTSLSILTIYFDIARVTENERVEQIIEEWARYLFFVFISTGLGLGLARRWWSLQIKKGSA
jgi:hypothetical protein